MVNAARERSVVIKKIPLALKLNDRGMGCPANDWIENIASKHEWTSWLVASSIGNVMGITGGIREVIHTIIFVHPTGFEETFVRFTSQDRRFEFIQNRNFLNRTNEA